MVALPHGAETVFLKRVEENAEGSRAARPGLCHRRAAVCRWRPPRGQRLWPLQNGDSVGRPETAWGPFLADIARASCQDAQRPPALDRLPAARAQRFGGMGTKSAWQGLGVSGHAKQQAWAAPSSEPTGQHGERQPSVPDHRSDEPLLTAKLSQASTTTELGRRPHAPGLADPRVLAVEPLRQLLFWQGAADMIAPPSGGEFLAGPAATRSAPGEPPAGAGAPAAGGQHPRLLNRARLPRLRGWQPCWGPPP